MTGGDDGHGAYELVEGDGGTSLGEELTQVALEGVLGGTELSGAGVAVGERKTDHLVQAGSSHLVTSSWTSRAQCLRTLRVSSDAYTKCVTVHSGLTGSEDRVDVATV